MKLYELLKVCSNSEIEIIDVNNRCLSVDTKYKNVADYIMCEVLDITTNGYEKIFITIDYKDFDKQLKEKLENWK